MISKHTKAALLACAMAATVGAPVALAQDAQPSAGEQTKIVVKSQDDLPRFTYPVSGTATELLTSDDATFNAFADKVGADVEMILSKYDIQDRATLRDLLGTRLDLEMLNGDYDAASKTNARIRSLQDKPDAKLLSGLLTDAYIAAERETGKTSGDAFEAALGRHYAAAIEPLPWAVVGNRIKQSKASSQYLTPDIVIGAAKASLDPAVAKTHALSNELAAAMISRRASLKVTLPHLATIRDVLTKDVAANDVKKPDIWAARDVTLTADDKLTPVRVTIWDSGVDLSLYPGRVYTDPNPTATTDPHGIAFDLKSRPTHGELFPLTAEQQAAYPGMRDDLKGFSDLTLSIDSPEAAQLRKKLTSMKPDEVPKFIETLNFFSSYSHGTHVSGIAAKGNPAIRLSYARITYDWKNVPDKPTEELSRRSAAAHKAYVDWMKRNGTRVVNMSWGGNAQGIEVALEKNGVGKDAAERKAIAEKLFKIERDALYDAIKNAPNILFVASAGNSDSDAGFDETIPASFDLPNLLVVGAVDQAGDEASFTSYGKTVKVDANGYQVESYYPGGAKIRESGTSMSSPNVVNLAAKLIALDPKLTPEQTIDLIVMGATTSEDGRRHNIDPKASVALLKDMIKH